MPQSGSKDVNLSRRSGRGPFEIQWGDPPKAELRTSKPTNLRIYEPALVVAGTLGYGRT